MLFAQSQTTKTTEIIFYKSLTLTNSAQPFKTDARLNNT
jgi:hypothetical protein